MAQSIVQKMEVRTLTSEMVQTEMAAGKILAAPIFARESHPRFRSSSVDGYAIYKDAQVGAVLIDLCAWRKVRTGGPVPENAFAVVMQEDASMEAGRLTIHRRSKLHEHIRESGGEFRSGEAILFGGTKLSPAATALLCSQGVTSVSCWKQPSVRIISTGDELSADPSSTQVRDSNGPMLAAFASGLGAKVDKVYCPDDVQRLAQLIAEDKADMIVISGGASVGEKDFLAQAVQFSGKLLFHGVNMRPGKPILIGHREEVPIVGLPGNPASAFVGWHLFGKLLLRKVCSESLQPEMKLSARLNFSHATEEREVIARVVIELRDGDNWVSESGEQASYGLLAQTKANGLAHLQAQTTYEIGDTVWVTIL